MERHDERVNLVTCASSLNLQPSGPIAGAFLPRSNPAIPRPVKKKEHDFFEQ
jgi:hypothetical protein